MKKLAFLMIGFTFFVTGLNAQVAPSPLAEGLKLLNYEKNKSALDFFKSEITKNPADPETIFWYGQAILAQNYNGIPTTAAIQEAKAVYQQALQAKGNDPWLLVGMAHIQYLEGAAPELVRNNLELAITSSKIEKGKNKSKNNPEIINAIGRVFAELPINIGDHHYAVEKINDLISMYEGQPLSPNLYINLGINHLKLGGENGGDAVTAFKKAALIDPKNAFPYYKIGKIYQTQSNKEYFEENYNKAVAIDPAIAPVYVSLYNYYSTIDTAKARNNLDLFVKYADKDPSFDYLYADYLFQVGQYDASLAKALELKNTIGITTYPRIAVLLAYNYDRKADSVSAKSNIEQFINNTPVDKILPQDYELAVKVITKFPETQKSVASILEKAIASDPTNKKTNLKFLKTGYEMYDKSNMYADAYKWFMRYAALNGVRDEFYYFKTASLALNALDGIAADSAAKGYISAFPDKARGYVFNVKAANLLDSANAQGLKLAAIGLQNQFYLKDPEANKQGLINNYGTMLVYFNTIKAYDKAIEMCDEILKYAPGDASMLNYKTQFQNLINNKSNPKSNVKPVADKQTATPDKNDKAAVKPVPKKPVKKK
jgi:cytochrome c-type biogenesis protein CcmH/NrfG